MRAQAPRSNLGETDCREELETTDLCKEFLDLGPQHINHMKGVASLCTMVMCVSNFS